MKISLFIPESKKSYNSFISKEIASAKNIKSRTTRTSVLEGLTKIQSKLENGKAFLWDGKTLDIKDYEGQEMVYKCGRQLFLEPLKQKHKGNYLFVVMDANHCTIAKLVGKKTKIVWNKKSNVPRKHDAGGQSQRRFERGREEALKQWHKKCADKLKEVVEEMM